jgi:3-polyprenyl-4-hydroxybenzoate decarboxylase
METAVREPIAVYAPPAGNGMNNLRVALRQRVPGEARNAIAALLGCRADIKHVFVVDEDIDIFSDDQMEWALSTRFQARRDLVIEDGFRAVPLDPSLDGEVTGAKAGFDLTVPFGKLGTMKWSISEPPRLTAARFQSIRQALETGPMAFGTLVLALGSDDGREVVLELEELSKEGVVTRFPTGEYGLTTSIDTNDA